MKTIKQWLEELPEPYRTQALENAEDRFLKEECATPFYAVWYSFNWANTLQGYKYWEDFYKKLKTNFLLNKE